MKSEYVIWINPKIQGIRFPFIEGRVYKIRKFLWNELVRYEHEFLNEGQDFDQTLATLTKGLTDYVVGLKKKESMLIEAQEKLNQAKPSVVANGLVKFWRLM